MITLLIEPAQMEASELRVEGAAYRHLFRARRLASGERVRLVDGRGRARWSEVLHVDRRSAALRLTGEAPSNETKRSVEILVAAPRSARAAWLVEKTTELGVAAVRFLNSERSPRGYGEAALERLRRVAAAAVEQSGRSRLPAVSGIHRWAEVPELLAAARLRVLLEPGREPLSGNLPPGGWRTAALLIGPEGGWTRSERDELEAAGCLPRGLGPRTLRVETAAVVAAAFLLGERGGAKGGSGLPRAVKLDS